MGDFFHKPLHKDPYQTTMIVKVRPCFSRGSHEGFLSHSSRVASRVCLFFCSKITVTVNGFSFRKGRIPTERDVISHHPQPQRIGAK